MYAVPDPEPVLVSQSGSYYTHWIPSSSGIRMMLSRQECVYSDRGYLLPSRPLTVTGKLVHQRTCCSHTKLFTKQHGRLRS